RAALGRAADELRRLDLREAERVECPSIARERGGGDAKHSPLPRVAERDWSVVENRRQLLLERRPAKLDRRRRGWFGDDLDRGPNDLDAAGRLIARDHPALDDHHGLRQQPSEQRERVRLLDDHLRDTAPVADEREGDPAEPSLVVQPAGDANALADVT